MESGDNPMLVICISPGINDRWDVSEKGFEEPLASFYEKEDAYAYATALTRTRKNATVLLEDREGFSPLLLPQVQDDVSSGDEGARHDGHGWRRPGLA
ncbi:hypothetical protein [Noviherbaspirillum galbum]|uniref:Uncharacterized protein n=1 Tax=Noviherbaspirillum galbum TaxID=2709383 RepID=A0A6B3SII1_9BURK|nr:hypothetical protein [Noviherbaspirillum galbum]NEX60480.1 hypothetical protein [Noviherbaspirillum galbum]